MKERPARTSQASYARAVERVWSGYLERPVILSAMDWSLVTDWHARGVPLQVVREAVLALAQRRRKSPPRGLGAIADAVEESWEAIVAGRVGGRSATAPLPPGASDPLRSWRACLDQRTDDDAVGKLLRDLLARHAAGTSATDLDAVLDAALCDVAPATLRQAAERQVDSALEPFRERMPAAALEDTRRRAIADRLRRRLKLERIAEYPNSP